LVRSLVRDTPGPEILGEAGKECRRAAQIEVGLAGHYQLLKHFEARQFGTRSLCPLRIAMLF